MDHRRNHLGGFPFSVHHHRRYGFNYIGRPWAGLIVFTVFCVSLGAVEEIVYSKTKCIWYAALLHGAINASATLPTLFMNAESADLDKYMVLGPLPNGIIAGLPLVILAVIMGIAVVRRGKKAKEAAE